MIDARLAAETGASITATGDLALGDASATDGFFSNGVLQANEFSVTVRDADLAKLGSLTEIGNTNGPGTLSAPNGLLLEAGSTLQGHGIINNEFVNRGHVNENSLPAGDEIEFTGDVSGSGDFTGNIVFSGSYFPGDSPALIDIDGNVTFGPASSLAIELGGMVPGLQYDFLTVEDTALLSGALNVSLIDGFVPVLGNQFTIITADTSVNGTFNSETLPALSAGLQWQVQYNANDVTLLVVDQPDASVVGRHVFYNNSSFDNESMGRSDVDAIAPDKSALFAGQTASVQHYTGYSHGLNGIIIDVQDLADSASLNVADFEFRVGNDNTPGAWPLGPAPASIEVRQRDGTGGSDRIILTWPDAAIRNTWLQVTVKGNSVTGLAADDVFYFGNAVGESGDSTTHALVNAFDFAGPRDNAANGAGIENRFDYNRDGNIDGTDMAIARDNATNIVTALRLIDLPGATPPETAEGEAIYVDANIAANSDSRNEDVQDSSVAAPLAQRAWDHAMLDNLQRITNSSNHSHQDRCVNAAIDDLFATDDLLDAITEDVSSRWKE